MKTQPYVTVSEAARPLGILPRVISDLFYQGKLDSSRCPIIGDRRAIPLDYLPELERVLRVAGRIQQPQEESK